MTLEEYVTWAARVGLEPGPGARSERGLTALGLGLASEVGEVAGVLVRWLRGEARDRGELAGELGDVAYWWARLCAATGVGASTLLARSRAHVEWRRAGRPPEGPASADVPASLEDFAAWVRGTDGAPEDDAALGDAGLALAGDAGEVVECLRRLGAGEEAQRARLAGELGDVWRHWTRLVAATGVAPADLLDRSRTKIEARRAQVLASAREAGAARERR